MTLKYQLIAIMALLFLPLMAQSSYQQHTVGKRETIYGICKKYGISQESLLEANPSLKTEGLKNGQTIIIPSNANKVVANETKGNCRQEYVVQKKETIYRICKKFSISQGAFLNANPQVGKNGLKKGQRVCIPFSTTNDENAQLTLPAASAAVVEQKTEQKTVAKEKKETLKTAVLLSFTPKNDKNHVIEFYEGFLMAADKLKHEGHNLDITALSTGNTKETLADMLQQHEELKDMDIIFGPGIPEQISVLSDYCKNNNIRLVIPFATKSNEAKDNNKVFQVNAPKSQLFPEVYDHIFKLFPDFHFVFLNADAADTDKQDFIAGLKQELQKRNQSFDELSGFKLAGDTLRYYIPQDKKNLFIPTSGKSSALTKLLPQLVVAHRISPEIRMILFGYPEWQLYTDDYLANFYEMDTYFYSSFYTNNLYTASIQFTNEYRKWFSKDLAISHPRYPMLGYDIAYYFLTGILKFGDQFEQNINDFFVPTIQSGFKFVSNKQNDGYINKKVYLVHFSPDFELVKIDFD